MRFALIAVVVAASLSPAAASALTNDAELPGCDPAPYSPVSERCLADQALSAIEQSPYALRYSYRERSVYRATGHAVLPEEHRRTGVLTVAPNGRELTRLPTPTRATFRHMRFGMKQYVQLEQEAALGLAPGLVEFSNDFLLPEELRQALRAARRATLSVEGGHTAVTFTGPGLLRRSGRIAAAYRAGYRKGSAARVTPKPFRVVLILGADRRLETVRLEQDMVLSGDPLDGRGARWEVGFTLTQTATAGVPAPVEPSESGFVATYADYRDLVNLAPTLRPRVFKARGNAICRATKRATQRRDVGNDPLRAFESAVMDFSALVRQFQYLGPPRPMRTVYLRALSRLEETDQLFRDAVGYARAGQQARLLRTLDRIPDSAKLLTRLGMTSCD